jgi:hypothetical protein
MLSSLINCQISRILNGINSNNNWTFINCFNEGFPLIFLTNCLTAQLQIEEVTRKLRTGDLGIAPNPEDRSEPFELGPVELSVPGHSNDLVPLCRVPTFIIIIHFRFQCVCQFLKNSLVFFFLLFFGTKECFIR